MPYKIVKSSGRFKIVRKADGKVVGTSDTLDKAKASIRARMSGESK